jgi:YidC/Oxa1 family membrane protein insertase
MEQQPQSPFDRGQLTKMLILGAVLMFWMPLAPKLFPGLFGVKPKAPVVQDAEEKSKPVDGAVQPGGVAADVNPAPVVPDVVPAVAAPRAVVFEEAQPTHHTLGAIERGKGFFLQVELTSQGAAVAWAKLNDERYSILEDRKIPLKVLGNRIMDADGTEPDSFQTAIETIDAQIQALKKSTRNAHWELLPGATNETATFQLKAPDGSVAVRKTYRLHKGNEQDRDADAQGYLLDLDIEFENLKDVELKQTYKLQGPVGLPLENVANARNFVEIKAETHDDLLDASDVTPISRTASEILGQFDKARDKSDPDQVEKWGAPLPLHFVGVDVQFFMALMKPKVDQLLDVNQDGRPDPYLSMVRPMIITRDKKKAPRSDISVMLTSAQLAVPPKGTIKHSYEIFLGPKRTSLARPLGEESALNFGRLAIITKTMVWILQFFRYTCHLPYGLAIILLTFTVRMCLLPITKKQVYDGEKMKLITPELTKLKAKYANEPEKFVGAQRELMRRYNHNMFGGCLPLFLQLPIFISLYNALYTATDLRMSRFLWIDNLAAPDALFGLGFEIPWIGPTFNLLPLLNVFLFLFQQKQMMPPAQNEEEEMRNKMMSYMTVFMGFLFYTVPAGLCLYFIASSLLGMGERHLLKKFMPPIVLKPENTPELIDPNRPKSFWERMLAAADAAKQQTDGQGNRPRGGNY